MSYRRTSTQKCRDYREEIKTLKARSKELLDKNELLKEQLTRSRVIKEGIRYAGNMFIPAYPENVDEDRDLDSQDVLSIVCILCVTAVIITAIIFTS